MSQVARISGPLLAANLVRTQSDLAFETDLLHIGSSNTRIGVLTNTPTDLAQVLGQTWYQTGYFTRKTSGNIEVNTLGARAVVGDINLNSQNLIRAEQLHTDNLVFNNNDITSLSNSDINFQPHGTGVTHFKTNVNHVGDIDVSGNITIPGNLTVGGNFTFGNESSDTINFSKVDFEQDIVPRRTEDLLNLGSPSKVWNNVTAAKAKFGDIEIDNDYITTTSSGNNLIIRASGTGAVVIDNMRFSGSTVTTTNSTDFILEPAVQVGISAAGALNVPHGTEAQRPNLFRDVRYNTTTNFFELFSSAYTPLRGIWSEDRQTYVLANAGNYFDFTTNNVTNHTLSNIELNSVRLVSQDNLTLDNGTISSQVTNSDINLVASSGTVRMYDLDFSGDTITNTHATNDFVLSYTNNFPTQFGHVAFTDSGGLVIPNGSLAARPGGTGLQEGTTRFNVTLGYLETYYNGAWNNVSGAGDTVNTDYMEELGFIYTLALG